MWLTHPLFDELVESSWHDQVQDRGSHIYYFVFKINRLKKTLKSWNKSSFGIISKKRVQLKEEHVQLEIILQVEQTESLLRQEKDFRSKLDEVYL